jgi:DNA-directed RNA polymerase subunit RPC12/RpoP
LPGALAGEVGASREGISLDEMRCTQCSAVSYSAAARTLVERGQRCAQCGGELLLAPEPKQPVGVTAEARGEAAARAEDDLERRFERD